MTTTEASRKTVDPFTVWWPEHLTLERELTEAGMPGSALFDATRTYRYMLTRTWAAGSTCAFIMLNPSTADAGQDDATVRRCVRFAQAWGHAELLILNLFAARTTNPQLLRHMEDPVGPDNDTVIETALSGTVFDVTRVVAAWGIVGRVRHRDVAVDARLRQLGHDPLCLGLTADASPRHPLRLRADTQPRQLPAVLV